MLPSACQNSEIAKCTELYKLKRNQMFFFLGVVKRGSLSSHIKVAPSDITRFFKNYLIASVSNFMDSSFQMIQFNKLQSSPMGQHKYCMLQDPQSNCKQPAE